MEMNNERSEFRKPGLLKMLQNVQNIEKTQQKQIWKNFVFFFKFFFRIFFSICFPEMKSATQKPPETKKIF